MKTTGLPFRLLAAAILAAGMTPDARAASLLSGQLTSDSTTLRINAYQVATYSIAYACTSTTTNASSASIVVNLDPNMELVATQRSADVTGVSQSGNAITFTFPASLPTGSTGQVQVQARFKSSAAGGTVAATTAAFAATNAATVNMGPVNVTGTDPVTTSGPGTLSFNREIYVYKWGPSSINVNTPDFAYYISHGNKGAAGEDIASYVIEDRFPPNIGLNYFAQDSWSSPAPGVAVTVRYITNLNGSWRQWGSGALYNTSVFNYQNASDLALPAGEYVTGLRWEYGTIPGGGDFHPDRMNRSLAVNVKTMTGFGIAGGSGGSASFNSGMPLGTAQNFNAFVLDSFSNLSDSEGPLAIGGNFTVAGFGIGSRLDASWDSKDTLIVGGTLSYNGGTVQHGNAVYASASVNNFTMAVGTKRTGTGPVNFATERNYLENASSVWSALPATAGVSATRAGSTLTINAGNVAGLAVVNVSATDVNGASIYAITNLAATATLLINCAGSSTVQFNSASMSINGLSGDPVLQQQVLWNFPGGGDVNVSSIGFQGSILAPKSNVTVSNGNIHGHVIATRLSSSGSGEIHWNRFLGNDLPDPDSSTSYINRIQNCANASGTGFSAQSCVDSDVNPPAPSLSFWNTLASSTPPGIGETFLSYIHLTQNPDSSTSVVNPTIVSVVPAEFEYVDFSMEGDGWTAAGSPVPVLQKLDNTPAAGQTLLRWRWSGSSALNFVPNRAWSYVSIRVNLRVRSGVVNGGYNHYSYAYWDSPANTAGYPYAEADIGDYDGDGSAADLRAHDYDTVPVLTNGGNASLSSVMLVKGELDSSWSSYPANGLTVPGGKADYQLSITNTGGVAIRNLTIIDVLPSIGDRGVVDLSARGSQWEPFLVDTVDAPPGVSVYYSVSRNPCRTDILGNPEPPGCETPAWTTSPPADITTVHSLKFEYTGADLMPGQVFTFGWPMRAPWNAPTGGEIAWNSFGYKGARADNGVALLPAEPLKTGIAIRPPDPPFYGDRVWSDTNSNGIQDAGEPGINGVRVELWRDNGDNAPDVTRDTFVTFTMTTNVGGVDGYYKFGNMGPGNFFAVVMAPPNMGVAPANSGADDTKDSDGSSIIYRSRRAAIMPVTSLTALEEDLTWDQGFVDRSRIPAVWAIASLRDGKTVLGGKFNASHGTARRNIERVNTNGSCDTSFNPGAGFNGIVRSLALRSDGSIWCGGNFTTYNGQPSQGVALLQSDGTWFSTTARTDTNEINWVGTSGNLMYLAGRFSKCGGITCGNMARLNADGTVDTAWNRGVGADGEIFCGAVLSDGGIVIGGAFSTVHGIASKGIARLKSDGAVDSGFSAGTGTDGEVYSIKLLEDGRMVLTGTFRSYNGTACNGAVRIAANGTINGMGGSTLQVQSINSSD